MHVWLHLVLPTFLDTLLPAIALVCIYRAQKNRIYPALWQFLIFCAVASGIECLDSCLNAMHVVNYIHAYEIYFYTYWVAFAIQAILMLRVLHEMFRHAVRSIPGVQMLGRPIFFWAIAVSAILAAASGITSHSSAISLLLASAQILERSQSILALCMLTFLAFASHTLGVSFRSRIFGVVFGFGLIAISDLMYSAFFAHLPNLASAVNIIHEAVYLSAVALWAGYFLQPEPARKLVAMPVTSPLMRWNEIAQTLGNPAGQVAVSYPPTFMTDVFDLVNNVMGPANWPREAVKATSQQGPIAS
jgi:hypothetical protein